MLIEGTTPKGVRYEIRETRDLDPPACPTPSCWLLRYDVGRGWVKDDHPYLSLAAAMNEVETFVREEISPVLPIVVAGLLFTAAVGSVLWTGKGAH